MRSRCGSGDTTNTTKTDESGRHERGGLGLRKSQGAGLGKRPRRSARRPVLTRQAIEVEHKRVGPPPLMLNA
jgi:hypothetical protein